jgi:hypothetical protein
LKTSTPRTPSTCARSVQRRSSVTSLATEKNARGFGLPMTARGPVAGVPTILPLASAIGCPRTSRIWPCALRT